MTEQPIAKGLEDRIEEWAKRYGSQYIPDPVNTSDLEDDAFCIISDALTALQDARGRVAELTELLTNIKNMPQVRGAHISEPNGHCVYCGFSMPKLTEEIEEALSPSPTDQAGKGGV